MGLDIDYFVVFLKEVEEVVALFVFRGSVVRADIRFSEELGYICF